MQILDSVSVLFIMLWLIGARAFEIDLRRHMIRSYSYEYPVSPLHPPWVMPGSKVTVIMSHFRDPPRLQCARLFQQDRSKDSPGDPLLQGFGVSLVGCEKL